MEATIRPAQWPADERGLAALDFSYITYRVYRLHRDALSFRFSTETLASPLRKTFPSLERELLQLRATQHVMVPKATANWRAWWRQTWRRGTAASG